MLLTFGGEMRLDSQSWSSAPCAPTWKELAELIDAPMKRLLPNLANASTVWRRSHPKTGLDPGLA